MNKIVAVNFSCSPKSMQSRGIKLLNKFIPFYKVVNLGDFNIPILDTNMADGNVPDSVIRFDKALIDADAYVFFISEMMGGYSGTFKNAMDWLVVKTNYDKDLNIPYSISHKPLYSVTFSPSYKNCGRHAEYIKTLLKMFQVIYHSHIVFNRGWEKCIPDNYEWVKKGAEIINNELSKPYEKKNKITESTDVRTICKWIHLYNDWDKKWQDIE